MAKNEILQIVVFSLFVGTAVAALDNKAPQIWSWSSRPPRSC